MPFTSLPSRLVDEPDGRRCRAHGPRPMHLMPRVVVMLLSGDSWRHTVAFMHHVDEGIHFH